MLWNSSKLIDSIIPESRHRRREQRRLPPLPKPNLEDVKEIFEMTGSLEMLEKAKTFEKVKS